MKSKSNIFEITDKFSNQEVFETLHSNNNVIIEKIISYGQITPIEQPYMQGHDEWVLIIEGKARLKLEDRELTLDKGQSLLIPKNTKHWVTYTHNSTIWLAIHIKD